MSVSTIELVVTAISMLMATAALAPFINLKRPFLLNLTFYIPAIACVIALAGGIGALYSPEQTLVIPMGLPDLPFNLRLDGLSGFFIITIAGLGAIVSIYSAGYMQSYIGKRSLASFVVFYNLFLAGMLMVTVADDAFFFLISWEVMAISSFFLVAFEDENAANRKAALLYVVVAHVGAMLILLSFGIIAGYTSGFDDFSGYTFEAMRKSSLPLPLATAAFFLAFTGFAAKAGVVPLHVWLPEAHPAAPSNVSALMSGVMLKTAIYGIIRVTFDIIHIQQWWWGGVVLALGLVSAIYGVLFAYMENDVKRLLAYSSVDNIGIILIGLGLSMMFTSFSNPLLASLALTASLLHVINHAMFKGLLFMGAGAIVHATHEKDMEKMGGLIHKMPATAAFFLAGCMAISSLPPLNGFVSEWLTFQAFLMSTSFPNRVLNLLIPLGAALMALTAALTAATFVKVYGVVFLGHPRTQHAREPHDPGFTMKLGMGLATSACVLMGVFPTVVIEALGGVTASLTGASIETEPHPYHWLWLVPLNANRASYSAPIVLLGMVVFVGGAYFLLNMRPRNTRKAPLWDCGFEKMTSRMQYSSSSFAMPIRRILGFVFNIREVTRPPQSGLVRAHIQNITYRLRIRDRVWNMAYQPVADASFWVARQAGKLQHGRIQIYILYSFATIITLLLLL
ncbi:MAG: hydrogenase 4 subunit B [Nitrospinae bacterium]|nr:hydrogenase 4 subunit B [Nitrospinota bacterium]MBF0634086.1 hydrogenase 4 subunit B [Nitrospinota bacterium]